MLRMNEKVLELGMIHSRFEDPSGLSQITFLLHETCLHSYNISTKKNLTYLIFLIFHNTRHQDMYGSHTIILERRWLYWRKEWFYQPTKQTNIAVFKRTIDGQIRPFAVVILGSDNRYADTMTIVRFIENTYHLQQDFHLSHPRLSRVIVRMYTKNP